MKQLFSRDKICRNLALIGETETKVVKEIKEILGQNNEVNKESCETRNVKDITKYVFSW